MLSQPLKEALAHLLSDKTGHPVIIKTSSPVSGGSINEAAKIETSEGPFFVKWNDEKSFPGMFEAEVKGLNLLKKTNTFFTPKVIDTGAAGGAAFLILQYVSPGVRTTLFWEDFGRALANMHRHTDAFFGLDHNNYIGSLPQSNRQYSSWLEFFAAERIEMQIRLLRDKGEVGSSLVKQFEHLCSRLSEIFPAEPPALLHGDLWSGNYMTSPSGNACIFDPAVYYGHREMDIAMTRLFGKFAEDFYVSYTQEYPMDKGWESRMDICNLYPLLVHASLFGGSYLSQAQDIVRKF